jgi:hypothetical protein
MAEEYGTLMQSAPVTFYLGNNGIPFDAYGHPLMMPEE